MIDRAPLIGFVGMAAVLVWVLAAGAGYSADVFWRTPSVALVLGGSVFATLVAFPGRRFASLGAMVREAFSGRPRSLERSIATLVALATLARRRGLLALERPVETLDDPFMREAMRMAVDGVTPETIRSVMQTRMESIELRHLEGKGMLEMMGRVAPVFGMIGTVIGLVVMLGRMDDPARIGPGMAVALLTTFYGLVLAHVVCLPLARKLGGRTSEELLHKTMVLQGVLAVQAGDHPRVVEQKLRAFLPGYDRGGRYSGAPTEPSNAPADHKAAPSAKGTAERLDQAA